MKARSEIEVSSVASATRRAMEGETGSRVRREITNKRESDADDHRARRLSRDSMFQKTAHLTLVFHQRNAGQKKICLLQVWTDTV